MNNPYFIQLIGVIMAGAGAVALTAAARIFGRPLTREERLRMGEKKTNIYRLPITIETVASVAVLLAGIGILTWSKFNFCAFLLYWLPNLDTAFRFWLSCR